MKYSNINWEKCNKIVVKMQRKIIVAWLKGEYKKVYKLQETLTSTFEARAIAVKRVTSNDGNETAGIDNIIIKTDKEKMELLNKLKYLREYKAQPLKRVYIKKKNGKLRPLGIPTIFDRCVQALYLLALDPIAETTGDSKSYGFRKNRSVQDVQRYIRQCLALGNRARYILDADIKGFFDNISHEWILKNIPMNKKILKVWLNCGFITNSQLSATIAGVPQGGIISPTIANMVLDGIEEKIEKTIKKIEKERRKEKLKICPKINYVRYADDFIITAERKEYFKTILDDLNSFFLERGIELNKEKTRIFHIRKGFDFLGFNFRKYKTTTRSNNEILLIKPSKTSIINIRNKARLILKKEIDPIALISKLNPVLRGWANYYKYTNAKRIFTQIDNYIFEWLIRWIRKVEGNKHFIAKCKKYFTKVGNRSYVFKLNRDNKSYTLFRLETTEIKTHVIVRDLNPYLKENETYFKDRATKMWMASLSPLVMKLLKKQLNICPVCETGLSTEEEQLEVHHIQPREFKGTNEIKNLLLLHKTCHKNVTNCKDPKQIARYVSKGIIKIPIERK